MPTFEDNLASQLRRQNIFGQTPEPISEPLFSPTPEPTNDYDVMARMAELYSPQETMTSRFNESIDKMPTRDKFKPGLGRSILAGLIALKDPKAGEEAAYRDYYNELDEWKTMMDPLYKGAGLENQYNTNMRAVANSIISQEMADKRLERQIDRDRVLRDQGQQRINQGEERLEQSQERINQAKQRLENELRNGGQIRDTGFGELIIVRKDGSVIPVDADVISREDLAALRQKYPTSSSAGRDRVREVVIDDPDNPGQKIAAVLNLDTNTITRATIAKDASTEVQPNRQTVTPKAKETTASEQLGQQREVLNNARKVKNSNPQWSKYITIKGNDVTITRPGIIFGPSAETYRQISQAIWGTDSPPNTAAPNTTTPTDGKIRVRRKSDGAEGRVSPDNPGLRNGTYEVIK